MIQMCASCNSRHPDLGQEYCADASRTRVAAEMGVIPAWEVGSTNADNHTEKDFLEGCHLTAFRHTSCPDPYPYSMSVLSGSMTNPDCLEIANVPSQAAKAVQNIKQS